MPYTLLKRGSIFAPIFALGLACNAQQKDVDLIFARPHYSFTIIPLLDQKASITKNIDKYWIHSTIMHGFEAGFTRYSHFDKKHSLLIGLFFGAFARNFNFHIPGSLFNPAINGDLISNTAVSREFNFTGSIPILFENRWFTKKNTFWDVNLGITVRYTPSEEEDESWTYNHDTFLDMQLTTNYKKTPWLNYNLGGGHSWVFKNDDIFKTSLVASLSLTPLIKGTYQFTVPNEPVVDGTYEARASYIGLSFSYVLTGRRMHPEH